VLSLPIESNEKSNAAAVDGMHDMGRKRSGVVWMYYLMTSERLFVVAADNIRWIM